MLMRLHDSRLVLRGLGAALLLALTCGCAGGTFTVDANSCSDAAT